MAKKKQNKNEIFGLISISIGIVSVFIYFFSILIPISAIVFGIISLTKQKNKLAIIGIILGGLFTFQYISINYLIPYLQDNIKSSSKYDNKNTVIKKAEMYGFKCKNNRCYKDEYNANNILNSYEINLDGEYIDLSFEFDIDGDITNVEARYGYNNGVLLCSMYSRKSGRLIDYEANVKTNERQCNYEDFSMCSFNMSISNDLVNYYKKIINN